MKQKRNKSMTAVYLVIIRQVTYTDAADLSIPLSKNRNLIKMSLLLNYLLINYPNYSDEKSFSADAFFLINTLQITKKA